MAPTEICKKIKSNGFGAMKPIIIIVTICTNNATRTFIKFFISIGNATYGIK